MEVWINNELEAEDLAGYGGLITKAFEVASRLEDLTDSLEVCVTFVDDASIQRLNYEYRGINEATDVLSFPQIDEDFGIPDQIPVVLGDIVISLDSARRQASEYGHSLKREVLYLAIHGFFHLLGYDHEIVSEQSVMRGREETVLNELELTRD